MLPAAFVIQVLLAVAAAAAGPWIARRRRAVWLSVLIGTLVIMVCWPLMRLCTPVAIELLGLRTVVCTELTAMIVPATLFFWIVARHTARPRDGRVLLVFSGIVAVYFLKAGAWMVWPGVGSVGPTTIDSDGVCRQSTGYTCVAASMVTMLRARGVPAEEEEMARLAHTEIGGGATDSRALLALREKLAPTGLHAAYRLMDEADLIAAPKPCLVQLDWGFFVSHMVPVMAASPKGVTIGDPLTGVRTIPMEEFRRTWKKRGITIDEGEGSG